MAQAFGKQKETQDWKPITFNGMPCILPSKEILQEWIEQMKLKFPENEYKIEGD